jgi:hypothetical protein
MFLSIANLRKVDDRMISKIGAVGGMGVGRRSLSFTLSTSNPNGMTWDQSVWPSDLPVVYWAVY